MLNLPYISSSNYSAKPACLRVSLPPVGLDCTVSFSGLFLIWHHDRPPFASLPAVSAQPPTSTPPVPTPTPPILPRPYLVSPIHSRGSRIPSVATCSSRSSQNSQQRQSQKFQISPLPLRLTDGCAVATLSRESGAVVGFRAARSSLSYSMLTERAAGHGAWSPRAVHSSARPDIPYMRCIPRAQVSRL